MKLQHGQFLALCEAFEGYCTECDDLTRSHTEPDATDYECPQCESPTVMGLEMAMVAGHVEVE